MQQSRGFQPIRVLLTAWLVLLLGACSVSDREQQLRQQIRALQEAIDRRDVGDVEALLADDFVGNEGMDRRGARQLAAAVFLRHREVAARIGPVEVELRGEGEAMARFTVIALIVEGRSTWGSRGSDTLHPREPPDLRLALGAPTVHRRPLREPLSGDRLPLRRRSVHRVEPLDHVRRAEALGAPLLKLLHRALAPDGLAERRLRHAATTTQGGEPELERVLLICHSTSVNAHANPVNFLAQPRILGLTPGADSGIPQSVGSPRQVSFRFAQRGEGC